MAKTTIVFGLVLTLLGVVVYLATGMVSVTALIPAFAGVPLLALGVAASGAREGMRKHLMHAAAMIGLLGALAPIGRLATKGFGGATSAVGEQVAMAVLCVLFVVLCVRSFVAARRSRAVS